ncbi:MAG TPA: glycosyltransferase family 9 protein [Stellaceae bacterium]|nr:glycosyltransferase family 9 protein [Stellaceae bacterium]
MYLVGTPFGRAWLYGAPLRADDFRPGTPLRHFFAWNEKAWRPDRRYVIANDVHRLLTALGGDAAAREICATHLGSSPVIRARLGNRLLVSRRAVADAAERSGTLCDAPALAAGRRLVEDLVAGIDATGTAAHAAVFAAFEALAEQVDLRALARLRHAKASLAHGLRPRRILVIRLSAFGDFVQSLGPVEALRHHHRGDRITLLTTAPFADFARELGWFDEVLVDRRPGNSDLRGWLTLRRTLRMGGFDRVYDLQTSQRSSAYRWLLGTKNPPEWSGIAARCSHPHANLDRDKQHTIDKQAEQLLMAGIYPTPLPRLPMLHHAAPEMPAGRNLVLIAPGSSPHRPMKRWPAARFGAVAQALDSAGYLPIVVGAGEEKPLAETIRSSCPAAVDLVGRTTIAALGALAQRAVLTVGNDNGASHLATAADCPVVVLFSEAGSDPALCAPRGRLVRIVAVPDLNELAVETVLAEARAVLRQHAGTAPRPMARST